MRYVLSCRNKVAVNSNEINTKGEKMKAVVFDMDGVIFDSETLVFRMWKVVAEKYGVADIEETCRACLGINATVTREIFFRALWTGFSI